LIISALLLALVGPPGTACAQKPNILIMLADDLGYGDIGANGCTDFATPHIDSIAKNGVRFTHGYVSAPVCSPSRAGLMTGRYQTRFGHEFNHPLADRAPVGLPLSEKLAPQYFREAGYATGHIGKWHLGNSKMPEYSPNARGFAESVWFPGQKKLPPLTYFRNGEQGKADDRCVDEAVAREASAFVEKHRTAPWFLYVAFLTPHQPLDLPPGVEDAFQHIEHPERRKCAAMMSLLDAGVGRILHTLRETGQEERTLIVFLSDNGAPPKNGSRNTPLIGRKGSLWEGGIRVPWVIQWKGTLPAGRTVDQPVISLDLLPTALAGAKIAPPREPSFDGLDLLPFLTEKEDSLRRDALFWRYGEHMAVQFQNRKLVRTLARDGESFMSVPELIPLQENPNERPPFWKGGRSQNSMTKLMQSLWDEWNRSNVRALWGEGKTAGESGRDSSTTDEGK